MWWCQTNSKKKTELDVFSDLAKPQKVREREREREIDIVCPQRLHEWWISETFSAERLALAFFCLGGVAGVFIVHPQ